MNYSIDDPQAEGQLLNSTSDHRIVTAMNELRALTAIMDSLKDLDSDDARKRTLTAAATFFRLDLNATGDQHISQHRTPLANTTIPPFSEQRPASPKEFILQKQPRTDMERVACLAYFLTHYRDTPQFKTIDISKVNTEAAQPKFSNAARAVDHAAGSHYLVAAAKGNKQISAMGELYVQALPDRDAAREAMASSRPRRRRKNLAVNDVVEEVEVSG